ncbi:MAG: hypothetical protein MI866_07660 [Bacteroidales bacterium]|nr:hypothetical protein [Bacteroidales bacterium]
MLYHSANTTGAEHHCCSHETCLASVKHKPTDGIRLVKTEDSCAICDYHFASKDVASITIAEVLIPTFSSNYITIATQEKQASALSIKSPRAPPAQIFTYTI